MTLKNFARVGLCTAFCLFSLSQVYAQQSRARVIDSKQQTTSTSSRTTAPAHPETQNAPRPLVKSSVMSQPTTRVGNALVNDIYVRPTVVSRPAAATSSAVSNSASPGSTAASYSSAAFRGRLLQAMNSWYGTPYNYGSEGPRAIDCSALVWRVFTAAGISFDRASAKHYWNDFDQVSDSEKYQFGTLVFFNGLGHVGIVIDENTFFHASTTKGVTFSKFDGYWNKRIVGFRRIPLDQYVNMPQVVEYSR